MSQKEALQLLASGRSAFVTGPAGCGKTHLLRTFIGQLKRKKRQVAVTASTGLAATHLNGRTIHSWAGIGIKDALDSRSRRGLLANKNLRQRVEAADVLIIDEISMLHDYRLDMIEEVCCLVRGDERPFGGLQVVLSGDFFQLPPVQKDKTEGRTHFAIHALAWQKLQPAICYLDDVYRQQENDPLSEILAALRENRLEERHVELLRRRCLANPGGLTELYCHNRDTETINSARLAEIDRREKTFWGRRQDHGAGKALVEQLVKSCPAPEELRLKEDALVMFVKNDPGGLFINGTIGRVVGFQTANGQPVVKTRAGRTVMTAPYTWRIEQNETELASFQQLPLKLAWAITIHKSQGMTLDNAFIDLGKAFEPGMGYVALSRLKSLGSLYIKGLNAKALTIHPEAYAIDRQLKPAA